MVGSRGIYRAEDDPEYLDLVRLVSEEGIGGVIWFLSTPLETADLNHRLAAKAKVPLLVAADLEAGPGMRFPDLVFGPSAMAVAATGDLDLAERRARATAEAARALGIHVVFAPVADVNNNPDNPVINVRSFGEEPVAVGRFVAATVKGLQEGGVLATLKHFPGPRRHRHRLAPFPSGPRIRSRAARRRRARPVPGRPRRGGPKRHDRSPRRPGARPDAGPVLAERASHARLHRRRHRGRKGKERSRRLSRTSSRRSSFGRSSGSTASSSPTR